MKSRPSSLTNPSQSTARWAVFVSKANAERIVKLRSFSQIQIAQNEQGIWLQGKGLTPELNTKLASIADSPVFRVDPTELLFANDSTVPTDRLPKLDWQSITSFITLSLPSGRYAQYRLHRIPLQLRRVAQQSEANVLITQWSAFQSWAETAPQVRLSACLYAVAKSAGSSVEDQATLVIGNPLPPILGERFYLRGRIAIPLGYRWEPAVEDQTVEQLIRRVVSIPDEHWDEVGICVWRLSGTFEIVGKKELTMALRQHVRTTSKMISISR